MRLWVVPSPLHAPSPAGTGPGPVSLRHRAFLRYVCEPLGGAELTTCSLDSPEGDVRRQGAAAGASSPTTSPSATSPPRLQQAFITTDPTCGSGSAQIRAGVTGSRPRHSWSVTASSGLEWVSIVHRLRGVCTTACIMSPGFPTRRTGGLLRRRLGPQSRVSKTSAPPDHMRAWPRRSKAGGSVVAALQRDRAATVVPCPWTPS